VRPVHRHQTGAADRHRDIAVAVSAQRRHTEISQRRQKASRGMAVVVMRSDTDHRDPGVHRHEEGTLKVRASVMWDLQHVGAQIGARPEQVVLRIYFGVAR
jgi:hypothetical protein